MKEFLSFFTIRFKYDGMTLQKKINLDAIKKKGHIWRYEFKKNFEDGIADFIVEGTLDDLGDIRTTGECYVNGMETCPSFYVNCIDFRKKKTFTIDDVDIIDCDAPDMKNVKKYEVGVYLKISTLVSLEAENDEEAVKGAKKIAQNLPLECWNDDYSKVTAEILDTFQQ